MNTYFNKEGYKSFSATDIVAYVIGWNPEKGDWTPAAIGNISALSYSIHRDKGQVRTLGRSDPKGITRGCIAEDELIYIVNGCRKIKDINIGDMVLSMNLDSKLLSYEKCINKFYKGRQECFDVILTDNSKMSLTKTHLVYTNSGWRTVRELKINDNVFIPSLNRQVMNVSVKNIISCGIKETYDLEIENNHNLFGKFLTHNSRTYAGSFVFSVFDRRALFEMSKVKANVDENSGIRSIRPITADALPAFDIVLYFGNESGQEAFLVLYGIEIMDEGQVHSVQDIYIENTMSFIFRGIDLLTPINYQADSFLDLKYLTNSPVQFINDRFARIGEVRQNLATNKLGESFSQGFANPTGASR